MTDDEIKDTHLYKEILAKNLSVEFNHNIVGELRYAFDEYKGEERMRWSWDTGLIFAFYFSGTPQGAGFWRQIADNKLPKEYQ